MSDVGGDKFKVLFVCLGNICRSPTAEAIFKKITKESSIDDKFVIDSCGTGGGSGNWYKPGGMSFHEGDEPDARMAAAAERRHIKLSGKSRPLTQLDLETFDLIVGMDDDNLKEVLTAATHWGKKDLAIAKSRSMTSYCRDRGDIKSVPDPYYRRDDEGFDEVMDILADACQGLLRKCQYRTA